MDTEYSKINFPQLRKWKKEFRNNIKSYSIRLGMHYQNAITIKDFEKIMVMRLIDLFSQGTYYNYFINDDVFHLLKNIDIKFDNNFIKLIDNKFLLKNISEKNTIFDHPDLPNQTVSSLAGIIYSKQIKHSYFFAIISCNVINEPGLVDRDYIFLIFTNGNNNYCYFNLSIPSSFDIPVNEPLWDSEKKIIYSVIINMFYYMDAYPLSILNHPPDEVLDKLNKENSQTVLISEEMRPYLSREMMPHLRRGHFRYLGSEFFTKKRNQTIFIKPTFIHGDAVTIIKNKDIE